MNNDQNSVLTTYYASLNPFVSFANSGCAPETVDCVKMIKIRMIKSCDAHLSLISSHDSHHCMRTDGTWWFKWLTECFIILNFPNTS